MNEYYYIDFHDLDIYSWEDTSEQITEQDKANKFIGNNFKTFQEAKTALNEILAKQLID